ncbi:TPA: hypothetical protein N0F65_011844 [Lagenidium giganteum]|uniref:Uncharacterized protein n=1 Tax=Lagenidium giganteum TaxID=4803 RepID=A0AAV2Z359_9STRA|nr:TPA: hypothetical protein N0F65_011844 [Lagenidium giganteum]
MTCYDPHHAAEAPCPSRPPSHQHHQRRAIPRSTDADDRITRSVRANVAARARYFDNQLPFSWARCLMSLISYLLLLSDVPRSGLGMKDFRVKYAMLGPNELQIIGPWNYLVSNGTTDTAVWAYKYDTTSIVWRAYAEYFDLQVFPRCLLCQETCRSDVLDANTTFSIIDAMASATARWGPKRLRDELNVVTLRTSSTYRDRLHHYLFPQLVKPPLLRTLQATYYPSTATRAPGFRMCQRRVGNALSCGELWTNFRRTCSTLARRDPACRSVDLVWTHIRDRIRAIERQYPGHMVDLTILEGREDLQACRGGVSYLARAQADISSIIRAQTCTDGVCTTQFLEDYRYEAVFLTSDAEEWYIIVVFLRALGQVYCYLRVLMLIRSCYVIRLSDPANAPRNPWRSAFRLFLCVPSQAIVYGSTIPVISYTLAHCIDSPTTYQILENAFTTQLGKFTLDVVEFCRLAAIQMRSLWLLAVAVQTMTQFSSFRFWSPTYGVAGFPEFTIAVASSATMLSQLRILKLRNTRVESIHVLPASRSAATGIKQFTTGGLIGNMLLEGVLVDVKVFLSEGTALVLVIGAWWLATWFHRRRQPPHLSDVVRLSRDLAVGRTPVPYSATALWPATAMCILWRGPVFHEYQVTKQRLIRGSQLPTTTLSRAQGTGSVVQELKVGSVRRMTTRLTVAATMDWAIVGTSEETLCFLQHQLENVATRRVDVNGIVGFVNMVNMSDPWVWFQLRIGNPQQLGYYASTTTADRVVFMPQSTTRDWLDWGQFELIATVSSNDIPWSELIQCGDMCTAKGKMPSKDAESVISKAALRRRWARGDVFDNHLPFSWLRWLRAAVSYLLLFTDVPRSGLGVHDLRVEHMVVEPNVFEFYGPWGYPVQQLPHNITTQTTRVWSYEYDTTSIIWRAIAQHFNLTTFPRCLFYEAECANDTFSSKISFAMIDSVASAMAKQSPRRLHSLAPRAVTLRTVHKFRDRLHHFVLPQLFVNPVWRTNQVLYYPPAAVRDTSFGICSGAKPRPLACNELWINFRRSCASSDGVCQAVGVIWNHIVGRIRAIEEMYANHQVDLTVLESSEDTQVNLGGLSSIGRRSFDVSMIVRVRTCKNSTGAPNDDGCQTVYVEDYRYEGGLFTTNVTEWYNVVSTLRVCGQLYFLLRVATLVGSCWVTRMAEETIQKKSLVGQVHATRRLFVRLPSQAVIYGSILPIACYALAHMTDAPFAGQSIAEHFTTALGQLDVSYTVFFTTAAVQMRNIWLLAVALHLMVELSVARGWSPVRGVLGAPPFTLSVLSSLTIFSHYRSISFRSTHVLGVYPLMGASHRMLATRNHSISARRGSGNVLLEGVILDFKMLFCLTGVLCVIRLLWWISAQVSVVDRVVVHLLGPARTPVPYSAGALWPAVAVCVQWRGGLFRNSGKMQKLIMGTQRKLDSIRSLARALASSERLRAQAQVQEICWSKPHQVANAPSAHFVSVTKVFSRGSLSAGPILAHLRSRGFLQVAFGWFSDWPSDASSGSTLRFIHYHLEHVHIRCAEVDAIAALMNLVLMSDPYSWFRLRVAPGVEIGFYQSRRCPDKVILLPTSIIYQWLDQDELLLLKVMWSSKMLWSDLRRISVSTHAKVIARNQYFDERLPFSWSRCALAIVAYLLLLTDVARSGLGNQNIRHEYSVLAPSELQFSGPWNYSVYKFDPHPPTVNVWAYKFDTTSVVWRAFAEFFNLQTFPSCLLYKEPRGIIGNATLGKIDGNVAFEMIDSMANATSQWRGSNRLHEPTIITLRVTNLYRDRLHHLLLPRLFKRKSIRTVQATHFAPAQTSMADFRLCRQRRGGPLACGELWVNFRLSCNNAANNCSTGVGLVWEHIHSRIRDMQTRFPGYVVDLTLLEGREDMQRCRGGLSYLSRAEVDISTIIRARRCSDVRCTTVFLEDYRYESVVILSDVDEWFNVVATLRSLGQAYCWLRVCMLAASCYVACCHTTNQLSTSGLWKALVLFVRLPSQAIVYGSFLPIFRYSLAHTIDAPNTYQVLGNHFTTQLGSFQLHVAEFAHFAAVQMRNIWLLAATVSVIVWRSTGYGWSPAHGVPGVPELTITLILCVTILSQLRDLSFRTTEIVEITHPPTQQQATTSVRQFTTSGMSGNAILEGILIDLKVVLSECLVLLSVLGLWWIVTWSLRWWRIVPRSSVAVLSLGRTPVPYTATTLWPSPAICILWRGAVFRNYEIHRQTRLDQVMAMTWSSASALAKAASRSIAPAVIHVHHATRNSQVTSLSRRTSVRLALAHLAGSVEWPIEGTSEQTLRFLLDQFEHVAERHIDFAGIVSLINLVAMSDPLVWARLRMVGGVRLGYYECTAAPGTIMLLPQTAVHEWFVQHELKLLLAVDTSHLAWSDLIFIKMARVRKSVTVIAEIAKRKLTLRNTFKANLRASVVERLDSTAHEHRSHRSRVFDDHLPFSWFRWVRALLSYFLVFSDVPRSGVGIHSLREFFHALEPNAFLFNNPWSYPVQTIARTDVNDHIPVDLWLYKFDTTSIVWRAFAAHFQLAAFPACLFYTASCASATLDSMTVIAMADAMADAVANASTYRHRQPRTVVLRTESYFRDRIHHYFLPDMFVHRSWRTNQALHYPHASTSAPGFAICAPSIRSPRPLACDELWVNFNRSCSTSRDRSCAEVGLIWRHIETRLLEIQKRFENATVDLTILESAEDPQVCFGGLATLSRRYVDVSTIIRARRCRDERSDPNRCEATVLDDCETLFLEDFRYEGAIFTTDAVEWFRIVAWLRCCGQSYFYLRMVLLFASCYATRAAEEKYHNRSIYAKIRGTTRLFVRLPSQAIIYGSPLPVILYVIAHCVDAPMTYETIAQHFTTKMGTPFSIKMGQFLIEAAVQMRSVWLLAFALHVVVSLSAWRVWSPIDGVLGAPPFLIGALSSLTIFAQYRALVFRNTRVHSIIELPSVPRRRQAVHSHFAFTQRGHGNSLLEGVGIDFKLFASMLAIVAIMWLVWACTTGGDNHKSTEVAATTYFLTGTRSPVPYSAGALWPIAAMSTQWRGSLFQDNKVLERWAVETQRRLRTLSKMFTSIDLRIRLRKSEVSARVMFRSQRYDTDALDSQIISPRSESLQMPAPSRPMIPAAPVKAGVRLPSPQPLRLRPSPSEWPRGIRVLPAPLDEPITSRSTGGIRAPGPHLGNANGSVSIRSPRVAPIGSAIMSGRRSRASTTSRFSTLHRLSAYAMSWFSDWPVNGTNGDTLRFVHYHFEHVHRRRSEVDGIVALMNLVAMSDPLVWVMLRYRSRLEVGYYQSNQNPTKVVLLPVSIVRDEFVPAELGLIVQVCVTGPNSFIAVKAVMRRKLAMRKMSSH